MNNNVPNEQQEEILKIFDIYIKEVNQMVEKPVQIDYSATPVGEHSIKVWIDEKQYSEPENNCHLSNQAGIDTLIFEILTEFERVRIKKDFNINENGNPINSFEISFGIMSFSLREKMYEFENNKRSQLLL